MAELVNIYPLSSLKLMKNAVNETGIKIFKNLSIKLK